MVGRLGEERVDGEHPAHVVGDLVEQEAVERVGGDVGQPRQPPPASPAGARAAERLVADDDHPLGAERQRRRDRRVQPRRAVDVVPGGAERRGHLDRREEQRDRRRRAHVLALQPRVHVVDLAVRARRRRRALDEADRQAALERRRDDADGVHQRRRRRWRAARPSRSSARGCAPAARDRAATRRASRAARAPRPPAAAARARCRRRSPARSRSTCAPSASARGTSRACSAAGWAATARHDRGVDPADARPAHDLDPLAARLQRRDAARTARPPRRRRARPRRAGRDRSGALRARVARRARHPFGPRAKMCAPAVDLGGQVLERGVAARRRARAGGRRRGSGRSTAARPAPARARRRRRGRGRGRDAVSSAERPEESMNVTSVQVDHEVARARVEGRLELAVEVARRWRT